MDPAGGNVVIVDGDDCQILPIAKHELHITRSSRSLEKKFGANQLVFIQNFRHRK